MLLRCFSTSEITPFQSLTFILPLIRVHGKDFFPVDHFSRVYCGAAVARKNGFQVCNLKHKLWDRKLDPKTEFVVGLVLAGDDLEFEVEPFRTSLQTWAGVMGD